MTQAAVYKHTVEPNVLPRRPSVRRMKYEHVEESFTLDGVRLVPAVEGESNKNRILAPFSDDEASARLRRYVLALSRYEVPKQPLYAKAWNTKVASIDAASRVVTNWAYMQAFDDDPSIDTTEVNTLARRLSAEEPTRAAMLNAVSLLGTQAWDELMPKISNEVMQNELRHIEQNILSTEHCRPNCMLINSPEYKRKRGWDYYQWLVEQIDNHCNRAERRNAEEAKKRREKAKKDKKTGYMPRGKAVVYPRMGDIGGGWYALHVHKPELTINHTGKMGRRNIATNTGRQPHNISRIVTDPDKRIFKRKTRALGGVVVIDNSGSMSLSEGELFELVHAAAGSTVIMYSYSDDQPNTFILARQGRMVREIPPVGGNNGVDGPVLLYSLQYRKHSSVPILWVSDGQVTGCGDRQTSSLVDECNKIQKKHNIVRVRNVQEAIKKMKQLQGGQTR